MYLYALDIHKCFSAAFSFSIDTKFNVHFAKLKQSHGFQLQAYLQKKTICEIEII